MEHPWLRPFRYLFRQSGSAALGICAVVFLWGGMLHTLHSAREAAYADTRSQTANLARAFEEQIVRSIKAVDQSLLFVRDSYARDPAGFNVATWARSAAAVTDVAIQLTLVDQNGIVRASSISQNPAPVDLSDREHIRVQMSSPNDNLFISKPVIGRVSHLWSIQFTRKLFAADGSFAGIAVLSLDPTYLTRFYRSIDLGSDGAITLIGADGVIRAAARARATPQNDLAIGKSVPVAALVRDINKTIPAMVGPLDLDGVTRLTTYRQVHDYPLIVAVGVGEAEVLADFWAMRRLDLLVATVLTAFVVVATAAMQLHQRRLATTREYLRESERRYAEKSALLETALEHMNQGIAMVDGQRRIAICNRRAMSMLDLPPEIVAQGALLDDVLRHQWQRGEFGPDGSTLDRDVLDFVRRGGMSREPYTYERKRPNGTVLEICSMPLQDGGVVRTYTDVTVRKTAEEDLRTARDQAHSATRAKSEFLATMSHEIRSPLGGLVSALDLLRVTPLKPDQAHMAGLAHSSALTLLAILNDILDFSKIEAGALTLSVEPVDIRALLSELTQPHALVAARKDVQLTCRIDPNVPELVRADRLRLGQIITNLLSNAVKFTGQGRIDLKVGIDSAKAPGRLRIDVRDTGCGMDARTLGHLFQPFTQADGSSSRIAGGTGLGLCISRRLAEMLDGTLSVVSAPGSGSCFTLLMPCIAEGDATVPGATPEPAPAPTEPMAGLRVLVVDDNPTNQWLTKRQLGILGADVETAANGQTALAKLETRTFDLLITDCHMPEMDGAGLTQAVRQSAHAWGSMPIIGLTADVTPEQARRCREAGMDDVLYKPVQRSQLVQTLNRHFVPSAREQRTSHPSVFDDSMFHDLFERDDPQGCDWLRAFCTGTAAQASALRALFDHAPLDRAALASTAHQIVGAALSVGVNRLAAAARALEHGAASEPGASLAQLFGALDTEATHAFAAIEAFLHPLGSRVSLTEPRTVTRAGQTPARS